MSAAAAADQRDSGDPSVAPAAAPGLHEDRYWLDAFRRGDPHALAAVFRRYAGAVFQALRAGVVVRIDGSPTRLSSNLDEHDLDNLTQETFARAFAPRARMGYNGLVDYGGYLATIARHLLIDLARQRRKESRTFLLLEDLEQLPGSQVAPTQEEARARAELEAVLAAFKASLTPFEVGIFATRIEQGLSLTIAARNLGCTVWKIRAREERVRTRLLAVLQRAGYVADGVAGRSGPDEGKP